MNIISRAPGGAPTVAVNTTAAQVFVDPNTSTNALVLYAPGDSVLEQRPFIVQAAGYCTTVGAYSVTVSLYGKAAVPATPLTASNWTLLKASTGQTVSTTSCPWSLEAKLIADKVSGKLQGTFSAMINNLVDVHAALTNVITSLDPTASGAFVAFMVAITFGTGSATNIGAIKRFELGL